MNLYASFYFKLRSRLTSTIATSVHSSPVLLENVKTKAPESVKNVESRQAVDSFLDHLTKRSMNEGLPSLTVVHRCETFWIDVREHFGESIPVPLVAMGADGTVQFSWKHGEKYLELDFMEESTELYYYDGSNEIEDDFEVGSVRNPIEHAEACFRSVFKESAIHSFETT